jgi:hypothetical protein
MSVNGDADIPIFQESEIDLATQAESTDELKCQNCGLPLEYSGRGRKPTVCKRGEGCRLTESATAVRRTGEVEKIRQGMMEFYLAAGVGVAFLDQYDGFVIGQNASKLADSWAALAEKDPKVRKALMRMLTGTSWAGVLMAHAMVALPIMQHHNLIPQLTEHKVTAEDTE